MAMLAEPRSKQKWSSDPRNTNWTNDTSRFGYQMLTKMGWQTGKGLGAKEDGSTTHVKSVKRRDNLGLGANKSNEDNWLSHQLEFDDLLSRLNDHSENGDEGVMPTKKRKKHEMEKTARQSRKRVFYNRFIQSKDLSSKSAEDMACIFGQRSKSVPGTPGEQSEGEESDGSTASCPPPSFHGVQTVNSGQNIQEYFEMKMKEMKAAREGKEMREEREAPEEMVTGEVRKDGSGLDGEEFNSKKTKKEKGRKRKSALEACELKSSETSLHFNENECSVKKKKKNAEVEGGESDEDKECKVLKETKREKRKKKKGMEQEIIDSETCEIKEIQSEMVKSLETEETRMKGGKKKDKKKRKKDKGTVAVDLEMSCEIEERNDQQNKLKKPRKSNKEKTCKESLPEAEETKDKRKKKCRKDKYARSLDVETVENEIKKKKEKKKKKVK